MMEYYQLPKIIMNCISMERGEEKGQEEFETEKWRQQRIVEVYITGIWLLEDSIRCFEC
jgi:hypothetical protein